MNSNNKIFICGEEYSVCKERKIGSGHGEWKI